MIAIRLGSVAICSKSGTARKQKIPKSQDLSAPTISNNGQHSGAQASPRKYGPPLSWSAAFTLSAAATKEIEFIPELVSHRNLPSGAVCGMGYHERVGRCEQADRRTHTDRHTDRPTDETDRKTGQTTINTFRASKGDRGEQNINRRNKKTTAVPSSAIQGNPGFGGEGGHSI